VNANHIERKDNAIADGLSRVGSDCYEFIQIFIVKDVYPNFSLCICNTI
jgi:hypothetical protein